MGCILVVLTFLGPELIIVLSFLRMSNIAHRGYAPDAEFNYFILKKRKEGCHIELIFGLV